MAAVGGDDAHRHAGEADETDDLIGPPQGADLEERTSIGHQGDGAAHVEGGGALAWHDGEQLVVAPVDGIVGGQDGGRLVDAGGQVGEEALGLGERLLLGLGQVVDRAVAAVDAPVAEILLGDVVAHGVADHRRAGNEELGDIAHHHREMAEDGLGGADAHDAAQQDVDHGDLGQLFGEHR